MTEHLLIDHFDEHGCAVLQRSDGSTIAIPIEWLPEEARQGHTIKITLSPDSTTCRIDLELEHGSTEPEKVNIGA